MRPDEQTFFVRFRRYCRSSDLIRPGDRLLLAVSGGADSRVMLDLLARVREDWHLELAVGHVNHQLRGPEADADAAFTATLAESYNLPFFMRMVEVAAHAKQHRLSLETAARELRYRALEELRRQFGAAAIVIAHTRDDQVETILAHVLRGSGLRGMRGMAPRTAFGANSVILRPLLPFPRRELLDYARDRQLTWREDLSNRDVELYRNRLRHELVPLLRARFNPAIESSLSRLGEIAGLAEEYFESAARQALPEVVKAREVGKIVLDIQQFLKYFRMIQAYVVRLVIQEVAGAESTLTFAETDRVLSLFRPIADHPLAFSQRRYVWRNVLEIVVEQAGAVFRRLGPAPGEYVLDLGRRCEVAEAGIAVTVARESITGDWRNKIHRGSQFIDASSVAGQLRLRFPRRGDRFQPLGMRGGKKLSDFFIDAKVPHHKRAWTPLVTCDRGIVWVCGYRLDERFKVTATTKALLHLQLDDLPVR